MNFILFLFFANIGFSIISIKVIEILFGKQVDFILENIFSRVIIIFLFSIFFIIFFIFNKSSRKENFIYTLCFFINISFIYFIGTSLFDSSFNSLYFDGYIYYFYDIIFYFYYIIGLYIFHFILLGNKNFTGTFLQKILYFFRDIILILGLYLSFTSSVYVSNLFVSYNNWEKINHYQIHEIYTCEDNKNIILNSSDHSIQSVNPYKNFINFINYYRQDFKKFDKQNHQMFLHKKYKNYLKNCISQNGSNYFDEYVRIHGENHIKINISK